MLTRYKRIWGVVSVAVLAILGGVLVSSMTRGVGGDDSRSGSIDQGLFQEECVEVANGWRRQFKLQVLKGDAEIQGALRALAEQRGAGEEILLPTVFSHLQHVIPEASALSASISYAADLEALKKQVGDWDDLVIEDYEYLSTWLVPEDDRIGCITVLALKIPPFSLEQLANGGGAYHNECSRCGDRHVVELRDMRRTIVLSCPQCEREYDLIAYDSSGRYRRAPEFLDRFALPEASRGTGGALQDVYRIWSEIREKCDYEYDGSSGMHLNEERWQTPGETYATGRGDCEDTSILLVDALISAGYPAKVAIGRNSKVGEHAWCVVKVEGEQYLLETTGGKPSSRELPRVSEIGEHYVPRQLFDRDSVYFRKGEGKISDYWSETGWDRIIFGEGDGQGAPVAKR